MFLLKTSQAALHRCSENTHPKECRPHLLRYTKTPTKQEISGNALTHIQSPIYILKVEIEKTSTYYTESKDAINEKLEHKGNRERDENETLCERIVLLGKENNCSKNEIKNQQFIIQMLISMENGSLQYH